jgi:hypothetical protein
MKSNIEHQSDGFTIVQGATTVSLHYDGDHQRAYQTTGTTATTYENDPASGSMEEVQAAGTTYTYQDYLKVDGHIVALRSCTASSFAACTATPTWTYVVTDQLGSTAVLTDASGTAIERDSTDPWGRPLQRCCRFSQKADAFRHVRSQPRPQKGKRLGPGVNGRRRTFEVSGVELPAAA